jgi:hypothetical protein
MYEAELEFQLLFFPVAHRDGGVGVPQAEAKALLAQEEGTHHWLFRRHARQRWQG